MLWNELFFKVSGHLAVAAFIVFVVIILFVSKDAHFLVIKKAVKTCVMIQTILVIVFWIRDGFDNHLIYPLSILVPFVVLIMAGVMTIGQWAPPELAKIRAENARTREEIAAENGWKLGSNPLGEKGSKLNS